MLVYQPIKVLKIVRGFSYKCEEIKHQIVLLATTIFINYYLKLYTNSLFSLPLQDKRSRLWKLPLQSGRHKPSNVLLRLFLPVSSGQSLQLTTSERIFFPLCSRVTRLPQCGSAYSTVYIRIEDSDRHSWILLCFPSSRPETFWQLKYMRN